MMSSTGRCHWCHFPTARRCVPPNIARTSRHCPARRSAQLMLPEAWPPPMTRSPAASSPPRGRASKERARPPRCRRHWLPEPPQGDGKGKIAAARWLRRCNFCAPPRGRRRTAQGNRHSKSCRPGKSQASWRTSSSRSPGMHLQQSGSSTPSPPGCRSDSRRSHHTGPPGLRRPGRRTGMSWWLSPRYLVLQRNSSSSSTRSATLVSWLSFQPGRTMSSCCCWSRWRKALPRRSTPPRRRQCGCSGTWPPHQSSSSTARQCSCSPSSSAAS
mmetsp:Transcript_57952/g.138055  ORF Transcript_57952/g.138055 Transcript_57952/m.138055 type:complete len:271 (+) Transcript_57952:1398-2210(+)